MTENLNRNTPPELSEEDAELLSAYIDNMLTDAEREALEQRLVGDRFLRDELQAMRQTVAWLNQLPELQAPRAFTLNAADFQQEQPKVVVMPRRNFWISAAAAVAVLFFGAILVLSILGPTIGNIFSNTINGLRAGDGPAAVAERPTQQEPITRIIGTSTAQPTPTATVTATAPNTATPELFAATGTQNIRPTMVAPTATMLPSSEIQITTDQIEGGNDTVGGSQGQAGEETDSQAEAQTGLTNVGSTQQGDSEQTSAAFQPTIDFANLTREAAAALQSTDTPTPEMTALQSDVLSSATALAGTLMTNSTVAPDDGSVVAQSAVQSTATELAEILIVSTSIPATAMEATGSGPLPTQPPTLPDTVGGGGGLPQFEITLPQSESGWLDLLRRVALYIVLIVRSAVGGAP